MSNPARRNMQEIRKNAATKDLLEPKDSTLSCEVGVPKKRDSQRLGDENASIGPLQSKDDTLNPEIEFANSTDTENQPPQANTEELRNTDELCCTDELYARIDKINAKNIRSHEELKLTQKLIDESNSH